MNQNGGFDEGSMRGEKTQILIRTNMERSGNNKKAAMFIIVMAIEALTGHLYKGPIFILVSSFFTLLSGFAL